MPARTSSSAAAAAITLMAVAPLPNVAEPGETAFRYESTPARREQQFMNLVRVRSDAVERAFGALFEGWQGDIVVKLVSRDEPGYISAWPASYDPVQHTLTFRRSVLAEGFDILPRWIVAYWPYYQNPEARAEFPIVELVDDALWGAHLQQAAHERGLTWPHEGCGSIDISQRLGCEMLIAGVMQALRATQPLLFNENRIDRIWPDDLQALRRRASPRHGREYLEVRRLGGILLVQPLIREFGVSRVAAYVAQTPFRIENDNVRLSALRYQERARTSLQW